MPKTLERDRKSPEPHFIGRKDRPVGRWTVEECAPKRGVAHANNVERRIVTPTGNTPLERIVRAHELMHTKISPAEDITKWIERGIASSRALIAVEELRVNWGLSLTGFDLKELTDGAEDNDGEYVAIHKEWDNAVIFAVATAGTGGGKRFLLGVRRHNKEWAKSLGIIQRRFLKEIKNDVKNNKSTVYSTAVDRASGLAPRGFGWTERMGEYLDRLCLHEPNQQEDKKEQDSDESESSKDNAMSSVGPQTESSTPDKSPTEILHDLEPCTQGGASEDWAKLVWGKVPLNRTIHGNLGRARTSHNVGRNPRRIHRLYTDPQRRIFDKVKRANGGIVLVDGSGSMTLSHANIIKILESAPGALVAIYSDMDQGAGQIPNIHIVAKDGKTVRNESELPTVGAGKGVDYPALKWAVAQRKNSKTPIIWVTDGGVCTPHGGLNDKLAMSCIKESLRSRVLLVENAEDAVDVLRRLHMSQTVTRKWPRYFKSLIRRVGGIEKIQTANIK